MPATDALVRGAVALLTGSLHLGVGLFILRRRDLAPGATLANRLFATWWIGLALLYLASGPYTLATAYGWRDLPATLAYINILLLDVCVAMWGVLGFLLYVYRGTHRWLVPLAVFYGILGIALVWLVAWLDPIGFKPDGSLEFARQLGGASTIVFGLLFSVPIFLAALAYLSLAFRITDRAPRYRIAMVGGVFVLRFGWSIVSAVTGLTRRYADAPWLDFVNQGFSLLVPVVVILAYRPPGWIKARLDPPLGAGSTPAR